MATAAIDVRARSGARTIRRDAVFVGLALVHGAILLVWPTAAVIAIAMWWNANTISHNFIHRPFFRSRSANAAFSIYLSAILGFPQSLWRDRHLAHHAGVAVRIRWTQRFVLEIATIAAIWSAMLAADSRFFFLVYAPGYVAGLMLCALQGHYEHARGVTSHYGRLYNFLFFNDGYHAEHHANPATPWIDLPRHVETAARASRWPAALRWLDAFSLEGLERIVLQSSWLQRMVLRSHARAIRGILVGVREPERIVIVGGGLFPRTAIVLAALYPRARITILDSSEESIAKARPLLPRGVDTAHARFVPGDRLDRDLAILPLSFSGDRTRVYDDPPARATLVHDWIWRSRGRSRIVSRLLLKRVNLIVR